MERPRDLLRTHRDRHVRLDRDVAEAPHPTHAWHIADRIAEANGWSSKLLYDVRRALVVALSCRGPDEPVLYSELIPLASRQFPVERTASVLAAADLLHDDRIDRIEQNWRRRLDGVAPAIFEQADAWLRHLRDGGPRAKPKSRTTVGEYARVVAPLLRTWSQRVDDLRQITEPEIVLAVNDMPAGRARGHTLIALRSLFGFLHRTRRIFKNPASRLKPGKAAPAALLPLTERHYQQVVAAASTPLHHVVLALVAVHAASKHNIRNLLLDDIDLGNRHTLAQHRQPASDHHHAHLLRHPPHQHLHAQCAVPRARSAPPGGGVRRVREHGHALHGGSPQDP